MTVVSETGRGDQYCRNRGSSPQSENVLICLGQHCDCEQFQSSPALFDLRQEKAAGTFSGLVTGWSFIQQPTGHVS